MSKYGNKRTVVDGITFDSKREAQRYQELKLMEHAGEIFNLEIQPKFELIPKFTATSGENRRAVTYTADFRYRTSRVQFPGEEFEVTELLEDVVEDVKSPATAKDKAYIIKRNMFEYQNPGILFREVL